MIEDRALGDEEQLSPHSSGAAYSEPSGGTQDLRESVDEYVRRYAREYAEQANLIPPPRAGLTKASATPRPPGIPGRAGTTRFNLPKSPPVKGRGVELIHDAFQPGDPAEAADGRRDEVTPLPASPAAPALADAFAFHLPASPPEAVFTGALNGAAALPLLPGSSPAPCVLRAPASPAPPPLPRGTPRPTTPLFAAGKPRSAWMQVTAYCACAKCCGSRAQGITASGKTVAYNGGKFVAADTDFVPFGTRLIVPGYNAGRAVEVIDRGSAIKGRRLDVYFPTHAQAKEWGRRWIEVTVTNNAE